LVRKSENLDRSRLYAEMELLDKPRSIVR